MGRAPFTLLVMALLVASVAVTPVTSMDLVNGTLGHPVDFTIPVPLPSRYRIDWNCGHAGQITVIVRLPGSGRSPQYNPEYTGRCELFENGTLRLKSVSYEDEGTYKVKVFNPDTFTSYIQRYQLAVYEPVSSVTLTTNTPGLLWPGMDLVSLQCSARGPDISYTWSLDGAPLPEDPRYQRSLNNTILTINPVSSSDTGPFTCTASNWVSKETSNKMDVHLASPVSAVSLTSNTSGALWAGQDSVSLYCTAQGSDITFSWRLNGLPVSSNPPYYITGGESPPTSTLTISPISRSHSGPFTCTATNWLNNETSNEINLEINWHPRGYVACTAQRYDDMLQLICSWPGGRPAANVTMIFNNIVQTGQNEVTRQVSLGQISKESNLTCIGDHYQKTFSCALINFW